MTEEQQLTKRERRLLRKQEKREARERAEKLRWVKKLILAGVVLGLFVWGVSRVARRTVGKVLGEAVADLGRDHTQDISGITYNSNPPTSGTHFPVWAKKGVYDRVISDGYLIHSLEHGYIVISYDCTKLESRSWKLEASRAYAHEEGDIIPEGEPHPSSQSSSGQVQEATASGEATESGEALMQMNVEGKMSFFTPENPPAAEVELPESFSSPECGDLKAKLSEFYEKNKSRRVIVVPRPNMDVAVALTAWGRILKLETWDEIQAQEFVSQWENKGPEKTVE